MSFHLELQEQMKRLKRNGIRKAKAGWVPDETGTELAQKQALHSQHLKLTGVSLTQDRGHPMKEGMGLFYGIAP